MKSSIENVRGIAIKEPFQSELDTSESPESAPVHWCDSDESIKELHQVEDWWREAHEAHAQNRGEMAIDHDYYDHLQWSPEDAAALQARGQAPLVFNKVAMTVDWVTGTERRTRIDFSVHPRSESSVDEAKTKSKLLKYLSDTNRIGWDRSRAFKDAAIGGVGWTEQSLRGDMSEEMILHAYVPWQQVWWDPHSKSLDMDDARYLHRRKWIDLDYAIELFPEREESLRKASRSHLFGEDEWQTEGLDLPQNFRRYDSTGAEIVQRMWVGAMPFSGGTMRLRVPITETWFRQPRRVKKMWGYDHKGTIFDSENPDHVADVQNKYVSLSDAVTEEIRLLIWVPGAVICRAASPFQHGEFPLTPIWAKRRSRDGMPYGMIRGVRDAQDDLNKRRSKALWLLSSNQFFYEDGAIDEDDLADIRRNLAKPNGEIKLKNGALSGSRIKVERNIDLANAQAQMMEQDAEHIHDGSGVNRENMGRDSNAISGRAITAKQSEGSVLTAELFDNLRLHVQLSGEKLLSLIEQYMSLPMQFRITGEGPTAQYDWIKVNQPELVDGQWQMQNDVTRDAADFLVDQVDFRESVREAQAEQFWDMLAKMPPDIAIQLLDVAVEMTDMPQRDEVVKRIRQMNGHSDPSTSEKDPALLAQQKEQQQNNLEQDQLARRAALAKVGLDEAKTQEIIAKAKHTNLTTKAKAMDVAGLIEALLPLAPAADRLLSTTKPEEPNGP